MRQSEQTLRSQLLWGISNRSCKRSACSLLNSSSPEGFISVLIGLSALKEPMYTLQTCIQRSARDTSQDNRSTSEMQNCSSKLMPLVAYNHADGRQDIYGRTLRWSWMCNAHEYRYVSLSDLVPAYQQTWQCICSMCSEPLNLADCILSKVVCIISSRSVSVFHFLSLGGIRGVDGQ